MMILDSDLLYGPPCIGLYAMPHSFCRVSYNTLFVGTNYCDTLYMKLHLHLNAVTGETR